MEEVGVNQSWWEVRVARSCSHLKYILRNHSICGAQCSPSFSSPIMTNGAVSRDSKDLIIILIKFEGETLAWTSVRQEKSLNAKFKETLTLRVMNRLTLKLHDPVSEFFLNFVH